MANQAKNYYYPPDEESAPLNQQPSAPPYYGTFQGNANIPSSLPPGFPQPVHPSQQYAYQTPVPGYPVVEGTPVLLDRDPRERRLPCCGLGIGWFLFIIGWFLASIPWYIGALILICTRPDHRERVGLTCCTIAAFLSLVVIIIGGATADS